MSISFYFTYELEWIYCFIFKSDEEYCNVRMVAKVYFAIVCQVIGQLAFKGRFYAMKTKNLLTTILMTEVFRSADNGV